MARGCAAPHCCSRRAPLRSLGYDTISSAVDGSARGARRGRCGEKRERDGISRDVGLWRAAVDDKDLT